MDGNDNDDDVTRAWRLSVIFEIGEGAGGRWRGVQLVQQTERASTVNIYNIKL